MSSTGDGVGLLLTWLVGSQGTDRGTSPCVREMMYFLNTEECCIRMMALCTKLHNKR